MNAIQQAVNNYVQAIVAYFRGAFPDTAEPNQVLFVSKADGEFVFDNEPAVNEFGIVISQADLDYSKSIAEQSSINHQLFDVRDDKMHVYENGGWSSSVVERSTVFKVGRLYFSPFTHKLFLFDSSYVIEQIKGTTV